MSKTNVPRISLTLNPAPLSDSCEIETANLPNPSTDACLAGLSADATVRKLVIVIHGFTKAFDTVWMHEMQRDIMRLDAGTAVVVRSKRGRATTGQTYLAILPFRSSAGATASPTYSTITAPPQIPGLREINAALGSFAHSFQNEVWLESGRTAG